MAISPTVTIPIEADPSRLVATIDIIVRHLTALREELLADERGRFAVNVGNVEWTDEQVAEFTEHMRSGFAKHPGRLV